jgi:hypothetical protein
MRVEAAVHPRQKYLKLVLLLKNCHFAYSNYMQVRQSKPYPVTPWQTVGFHSEQDFFLAQALTVDWLDEKPNNSADLFDRVDKAINGLEVNWLGLSRLNDYLAIVQTQSYGTTLAHCQCPVKSKQARSASVQNPLRHTT